MPAQQRGAWAALKARLRGCMRPQVHDERMHDAARAATPRASASEHRSCRSTPGSRSASSAGADGHRGAGTTPARYTKAGVVSVYSIDAIVHAHQHQWSPQQQRMQDDQRSPHTHWHRHRHDRVLRIQHSGSHDVPDGAHARVRAVLMDGSMRSKSSPAAAQLQQLQPVREPRVAADGRTAQACAGQSEAELVARPHEAPAATNSAFTPRAPSIEAEDAADAPSNVAAEAAPML